MTFPVILEPEVYDFEDQCWSSLMSMPDLAGSGRGLLDRGPLSEAGVDIVVSRESENTELML